MTRLLCSDDLETLAPSGHYIALRVGFAFPMEEVNALPPAWVDYYTQRRFMLHDPVIRWMYSNVGAIRWSEITIEDPMQVMRQAQAHGLRFGAAICHFDGNQEGQRSFASFARPDREFQDVEIRLLMAYVTRLHRDKAPPTNLTAAEIEALRMVKQGLRLKQIAYDLGVSEGAVKQRLKNAKAKLGALTSAQAATTASQFGLI